EKAAVQDADRIIGMLEQAEHIDAPKLVVNRVKNHLVESGDMLDIDDIMRILSIDLLGVVIDDEEVIAAANRGVPVTMNPDNYA
ncbi:septum site-determining protein MinD, partial [Brevibacillus sp. SIMBA_076]